MQCSGGISPGKWVQSEEDENEAAYFSWHEGALSAELTEIFRNLAEGIRNLTEVFRNFTEVFRVFTEIFRSRTG